MLRCTLRQTRPGPACAHESTPQQLVPSIDILDREYSERIAEWGEGGGGGGFPWILPCEGMVCDFFLQCQNGR